MSFGDDLDRQRAHVMRLVRQASHGWADAMRAHKLAPPDADFAHGCGRWQRPPRASKSRGSMRTPPACCGGRSRAQKPPSPRTSFVRVPDVAARRSYGRDSTPR